MEIPWIVDPTFFVFSLYMEALISYRINPVRVNVITKQRSCFLFESEPNLKKGTFGFQIGVVNKKKFSPLIMAAAALVKVAQPGDLVIALHVLDTVTGIYLSLRALCFFLLC
jgi:hypothetical protein